MSQTTKGGGGLAKFFTGLVTGGLAVYLLQQFLPPETLRGVQVDCKFISGDTYIPLVEGKGEFRINFFAENSGANLAAGDDAKLHLDMAPADSSTRPKFRYCRKVDEDNNSSCQTWAESTETHEIDRSTQLLVKLDQGGLLRGIVQKSLAGSGERRTLAGHQVRLIVSKKGLITNQPIKHAGCAFVS